MAVHIWLSVVLLFSPVITGTEEDDVGVANDYIDEVLKNFKETKEMVEKVDPLRLPDINEGNFQGRDMWLRGLSSLHRSGDCTISYDGDIIRVLANIAVNDLRIDLNYRAKALFWIKGRIDASLNRLAVRGRLRVDQEAKRAYLEEFKVTEFGTIKVKKITGLSFMLNWLLKLIVQSIANKSKPKIIEAMETEVSKLIAKELEKVVIPLH